MPKPKKPIVRLHELPPIGPRPKRPFTPFEPEPGQPLKGHYVRKVRGNKWQARPWNKKTHNHTNLGLYDSRWKAQQVVDRYLETGVLPSHLLPQYVYRRGEGFYARYLSHGLRFSLVLPGPYSDPMTAHRAMKRLIAKMRPVRLEEFRVYYGSRIVEELDKQQKPKSSLVPIASALGISKFILKELIDAYGIDGLQHSHVSTPPKRAI